METCTASVQLATFHPYRKTEESLKYSKMIGISPLLVQLSANLSFGVPLDMDLPLERSALICLLISRSMNGVSPNGKNGAIRRCQTSGAGMVSKNGFFLRVLVSGMNSGFVTEWVAPRPLPDGSPFSSGTTSSPSLFELFDADLFLPGLCCGEP